MDSSVAALVEELEAAFPATRPGRFVPMVNSVQGDEPLEIEAAFADKDDWTRIAPAWLDGLESALSFLGDEAIRFYVPAYLRADLLGALHQVDPTFALAHGFDDLSRGRTIRPRQERTWTDFARDRWDGLTRDQAAAVVHYLEWRVEQRDGPGAGGRIIEALAAYWYPRAAGIGPGDS